MSLKLYYRPSFNRTLKHLGYEQRKIVGLILEAVSVYYSRGSSLLEAQKIAPRFFYKQEVFSAKEDYMRYLENQDALPNAMQ